MKIKKQEWGLFRNEQGENEKQDIPDNEKERQIIPDSEIKELARLGRRIEEHYGKPMDIEWAIEKDQVLIVQARAVTTFHKEEKVEEKSTGNSFAEEEAGKILVKGETASRGVYAGKVKIIKDIYSKFKRISFDSNITLQKLVNRSVDKYIEDDLFRTEINEYQNLQSSGSQF